MANTKRPSESEQNEVLPLCGVVESVCNCVPKMYFIHTDDTIYCRWCGKDYK